MSAPVVIDDPALLWEPTRAEGLTRLADFAPSSGGHYAVHRNTDLGPDDRSNVSTLSPFLRHRLVTEPEVIAAAQAAHGLRGAERFIQEVGWRTYWKGWLELRPEVWTDYQAEVRRDRAAIERDPGRRERWERAVRGESGIRCFDAWLRELVEIGYLHNHARMWFASIWIFTLDLPWSLGADLFLRHLLCGDPASNTLSWRWVAGLQTRGKTYVATPENIAKFTNGRFKPKEPLATEVRMPDGPKNPQPGNLPAADPIEGDAPFGLLLTEDDLHAEDFDLPRRAVRGVAGVSHVAGRSPEAVSRKVVEFTSGALLDGLDRAASHFEVGHAGSLGSQADENWADRIAEWAGSLGVARVVVPYVPVGPSRDRLDAAAGPLLDRHGVRLLRVRREWDSTLWPLANAGYFPFRERFLKRLGSLLPA